MEDNSITQLVPNLGIFILGSLLFLSAFISLNTKQFNDNKPEVLGAGSSARIEATVNPQEITIIVHPEKRIPATGNWGTIANFRVLDCVSKSIIHNFSGVVTDNTGTGVVTLTPADGFVPGTYAFSVKGYSHLNKHFDCAPVVSGGTVLDFTPEGEVLAGDTSAVIDNYVNSLDISNNIINLFTNDYRNDLNQDTEVNSLDLSNIITNLFILGDPY